MKNSRRKVHTVILSDIHLGTYGCHAKELNKYLKSINPKKLILNGDIVDIWQFSKRYWPKSHMKVVKQILNLASKNTKVYYVTGNHDETLRRFSGLDMGNLKIVNKLDLTIDGKKAWVFHGDIFDAIMKHTKWLAKLGSISYDTLIIVNLLANKVSKVFGRGKVSISRRIKDNVKTAVKYINNFEDTVAHHAIRKGYDIVICGHIHHPEDKIISDNKQNTIRYLNSGDWIENLTALEYHNGMWKIYKYNEEDFSEKSNVEVEESEMKVLDLKNKDIFQNILDEFQS